MQITYQASVSAHTNLQTHTYTATPTWKGENTHINTPNSAMPLILTPSSINYLSTCRVISDEGWILAWICKYYSLSRCVHSRNVQTSAPLQPTWPISTFNTMKCTGFHYRSTRAVQNLPINDEKSNPIFWELSKLRVCLTCPVEEQKTWIERQFNLDGSFYFCIYLE